MRIFILDTQATRDICKKIYLDVTVVKSLHVLLYSPEVSFVFQSQPKIRLGYVCYVYTYLPMYKPVETGCYSTGG